MRRHQAVGDQVPPARVARQAVEREQRGLAAGVIAHRERQSRRVDPVLVNVDASLRQGLSPTAPDDRPGSMSRGGPAPLGL